MTTLDRPLRRLVTIAGRSYVVTISAEGLRIVLKGHRKGVAVTWDDILSGGIALDAQLAHSISAPNQNAGRAGDQSS